MHLSAGSSSDAASRMPASHERTTLNSEMQERIICVVGNPNCGKTTLFNELTGSHQEVGNWPGVTVDKKTGRFTHKDVSIELVDLPGIYSITPSAASGDDERISRDYILTGEAEAVLNIVDASNLERNLYLTAQLIEMRVPMLVVVNMLDIAKQHKIDVDLEKLSKALGCPVVGLVASKSTGVDALKDAILDFLAHPTIPPMQVKFDERIEAKLETISAELARQGLPRPRWFAGQLLETASGLDRLAPNVDLAPYRKEVEAFDETVFDGNLDIALATCRYDFVDRIALAAVRSETAPGTTLSERIDRIVLNRWLGLPIFLFIMYLMFLFTQNAGAAFIDFFDILVGGVMVTGFGELLTSIGVPEFLKVLLAEGVGGGLQTVSTFIPVVFFLYLFLAALEDSGYMARAAFVMDRFMRTLGLPGKAFVPLIVGFGCNVPAIMAARTMDRVSDRIITALMTPFMSCGARLPVYVLFATAFFPTNGQNLVFCLYVIGIAAAVLTGFLLKRRALPGEAASFVMEIPPYNIPTVKGVMKRTWERVKSFTLRAGETIVIVVAGLTFLNSFGTDGTFGNENTEKSALSAIGRTIVPAFEPMGIAEDNWPAAVGIFTGVFAKEAVVGTLNSLYAAEPAEAAEDAPEDAAGFSFTATLSEAVGATWENLKGLGAALSDPLGLSAEAIAESGMEENEGTLAALRSRFASQSSAFAYLLLILLYMPCVASLAVIRRETSTAWMALSALWSLTLGYAAATIVYRTVNFAADPLYASIAIAASAALLVFMYFFMGAWAKKDAEGAPRVIPIRPAAKGSPSPSSGDCSKKGGCGF